MHVGVRLLLWLGLAASAGVPVHGAAPARQESVVERQRRLASDGVDRVLAEWSASERRDPRELGRALEALGPAAEESLCRVLRTPPAGVPLHPVVSALGRVGRTDAAADALASLLRAGGLPERLAAAEGLGLVASEKGLVPLLAALDEGELRVRVVARRALLSLRRAHADLPLLERLLALEADLAHHDQFCLVLGELATPSARTMLRNLVARWADEDVVLAALGGLWVCGTSEDGEAVHAALQLARVPAVERKSALVLGRLGHRPATRDLIDRLYSDHRGVVRDAHWALGRLTGLNLEPTTDLWEGWWERNGRHTHGGESSR